MATTTCPKCGGTSFEVAPISPRLGKFKKAVVQCASCGTPIPVMDDLNVADQTEKILERLDRIDDALKRLFRIQ